MDTVKGESAVKKWNVFKKKGGQIVRRMVSNICCPSKKKINVKMPEYFFRIH